MKHFVQPQVRARRLATYASSLLLAVPGIVRPVQAETEMPDKGARINELVSHYQQCGYLSGAVLVAEHGKVIYAKGVGDADRQSHTPNTPQTRFGIASITKQFTAVLVLKQVAKGTVRLDGTVSEYLPWYRKDTGQRMTVEQLLHHTSGLPPDYDRPEFSDSAEACRHYEPKAFAEEFCQSDLVTQPGTKWAYSNSGYVLLGLILEHATGRSFADLLNDQILVPLGMKNTGLCRSELPETGFAVGYTRHAGRRYTVGPGLDMDHIFSAGAMYSTVEDLFVWNQALSSGELLPAELREQVFKPGMNNWAYGWFVTRIPTGAPGSGGTLAEMRGDMPGNFFSWILRYPDRDGVIIVLRNGYGSTEHLEEKLQALLFGQQPAMPSRNAKDVLAHAWWVAYEAANAHQPLACLAMVTSLAGLWLVSKRPWVPRPKLT
jgi:CubicO group peptidase (beta-lactamase class C family)